jgi:hypothetical protein
LRPTPDVRFELPGVADTLPKKESQMGFLDNVKSAADQVATRAKDGVDEVQAKRNLTHAYEDLGRTAFQLIEENEISHPRLVAQADEVRKFREQTPDEPAGAAPA